MINNFITVFRGLSKALKLRNKISNIRCYIMQTDGDGREEIGIDSDGKHSLPSDAVPLENQVAGHFFGKSQSNYVLRHRISGDVLKPICDKRSEREYQFYSLIWDSKNDCDNSIVELRKFIPKYNGILKDQIDYLRLSNVTIGFNHPSILDIKIGPKTHDPEASHEKIFNEINKYQFAAQLGFRILGMRIYDNNKQEYTVMDKDYGKSLTPNNIGKALSVFANKTELINEYKSQLIEIRKWFETSNINRWQFISSSLLFVHDNSDIRADIKMIDFAHIFPNNGRDENYIFGLEKLIEYFDTLK